MCVPSTRQVQDLGTLLSCPVLSQLYCCTIVLSHVTALLLYYWIVTCHSCTAVLLYCHMSQLYYSIVICHSCSIVLLYCHMSQLFYVTTVLSFVTALLMYYWIVTCHSYTNVLLYCHSWQLGDSLPSCPLVELIILGYNMEQDLSDYIENNFLINFEDKKLKCLLILFQFVWWFLRNTLVCSTFM